MPAPRSSGGFQVHRDDIDALAEYVDTITPIGGDNIAVDHSATGKGRPIHWRGPVGAAGTTPQPFQLVAADDTGGAKVRVVTGNLASGLPSGFSAGDDPPYVLGVTSGDIIYACVTGDTSSTSNPLPINSRTLGKGSTVPADDPVNATFYYRIGSVSVTSGKTTPTNQAYGPIDAVIYRNWYAFPKSWGVDWNAS